MGENLPSKEDFILYERMRQSGKFNMFDPRAQQCSGLDQETYRNVMSNYSELNKLYPDVRNMEFNEELEIEVKVNWKPKTNEKGEINEN